MSTWFSSLAIIAHLLGIALLNTLWHAAILYILLRIVLATVKNSAAVTKYALAYIHLGAICAWFVIDCVHQIRSYHVLYGLLANDDSGVSPAYNAGIIQQSSISDVIHTIEMYIPLFWYVYIPGLLIMLSRLILNMVAIYTYRANGIQVHQPSQKMLQQLLSQMNITHPVHIYLSERVKVPVMMGAIRPFILLPVNIITQLDDVQLKAIVMHELAHIKRHDYLLNLLQVIVETVLFFNPFVWLINGIIRREREHCCDDMVIVYSQQPYEYATALASLEEYRAASPTSLAATGNKNHLFTRIKRIIEMKKTSVSHHYLPGVVLLCIMLLIPLFFFTPGFAQKIKNDNTQKMKHVIIVDSASVKTDNILNDEDANSDDDMQQEKHKVVIIKKLDGTVNEDTPDTITLPKIDADKIMAKAQEAMKNAQQQMPDKEEMDKVMAEVNKALKQANKEIKDAHIDQQLKQAQIEMDKINWDAISKEISDALKEVQIQMSDSSVNGILNNAKKSIRVAQSNAAAPVSNPYNKMLAKMQTDGLINKEEGFKIEKNGDHLYINDDKQPQSVYNRYSKYFSANQVTIKGKKNRLTIDIDD